MRAALALVLVCVFLSVPSEEESASKWLVKGIKKTVASKKNNVKHMLSGSTTKKGRGVQGGSVKNKHNWSKHSKISSPLKTKAILTGTTIFGWGILEWTKQYSEYKTRFNKPEGRNSFETFRQNAEEVYRHNNEYEAGNQTWWKGINAFTDMTEEELGAFTGYESLLYGNSDRSLSGSRVKRSMPDLYGVEYLKPIDYRKLGVVSPVKDQGTCGSCFAFALLAAMESKYALNGKCIVLSEQHVVDCSKGYGNKGCSGGSFRATLNFTTHVGVDTAEEYPYNVTGDGVCRAGWQEYDHRITKWEYVDSDKGAMVKALSNHGPIVTSIVVDKEFFAYAGGVFTVANDTAPNHAILIVGYDHEHWTDVWYLKNSWGEDWGEGGFMSIQTDLRGIGDECYAIVDVKSSASQSEKSLWVGIHALYLIVSVVTMHISM